MKKKILFLIHDLGHGGAEKVLVNLVNNMDRKKFDITVMALFGGGVNEQFLKADIRYKIIFSKCFVANSKLMKILTPEQLHSLFIKEKYDIEIAYLEGPAARIISGCKIKDTKLVCWIHVEQKNRRIAAGAFRSFNESRKCYECFDNIVCVSNSVRQNFLNLYPLIKNIEVLYNTNESEEIVSLAQENVENTFCNDNSLKLIGVGKVVPNKGFDRFARIHKRLIDEGISVHTYILGEGQQQEQIQKFLEKNNVKDTFTFLGYHKNPYKYISKCDLFVCTSFAEGFSTAATEALILGVPVCTVEVSGMKEMLGENNEYGIVTENDEDALYKEIKTILEDPLKLRQLKVKAKLRGKTFNKENTVKAVEEFLIGILKK